MRITKGRCTKINAIKLHAEFLLAQAKRFAAYGKSTAC